MNAFNAQCTLFQLLSKQSRVFGISHNINIHGLLTFTHYVHNSFQENNDTIF